MVGYESYSAEGTDGDAQYLHTLLPPGETFVPPLRAVIRTDEATEATIMDGTAVTNETPNSALKVDSGANVKNDTLNNTTDPVNFGVTVSASANSNHIRVGDLIRIENEIMEVIGTYEDDPTSSSLVEGDIRCKRGSHGSTNAAHSDDPDIYFPLFNQYHDYDKFTVVQTDSSGNYRSTNFPANAAIGRAGSGVVGIVPGSVSIKFYEPGYQTLSMSGVHSGTNSGLEASTEYGFDITVDGAGLLTSDYMKFTVDSSNLTFGSGANSVLSKIQAVLDEYYYKNGSAILGERVTVGIVDGDIRFTSGQHLSTSAILLAAPSGGETSMFGVGRIPTIGLVNSPVSAKLPDDVLYDKVTYNTSPNTGVFVYDDGNGNLFGVGSGSVNYETGAIDMHGCPYNAEFVTNCLHKSAFSGKLTEVTDGRTNTLLNIYANCPSQKWNGSVHVKTY
jgi:hypothetical protein